MEPKNGFADILKREIGFNRSQCFSRRLSASEAFVKRLDLYGKLEGHQGCVNAVEFNSAGDLLVSGSDDMEVMFWNWATKTRTLTYSSGHHDNIFQTKIMPYSNDRRIVTSAGDGQIRLGEIWEDGRVKTKKLGKHRGRVYKLAVEPGSPYILYSCSEDGFIQHFDLRSSSATKLFHCTSLTGNKNQNRNGIRLNTIVIDPRNPNNLAVGGSDEYARVYDIRNCQWDPSSNLDKPVNIFCPHHLIQINNVHITGLSYSYSSELLVSYNDEHIYLFQKSMGLGPSPSSAPLKDMKKIEEPQVYKGHRNAETVKGVNFFGPCDDYVVSGSDCGHIFIWKKKGATLVRLMVGDRRVVNQLEPHPHMPFLATCGIETDVKLWAPLAIDVPPLPVDFEKIMELNRRGRDDQSQVVLTPDVIMHVLRLQRRQARAYVERRNLGAGNESEDENDEADVLRFFDSNASSNEGSTENSLDCNIS